MKVFVKALRDVSFSRLVLFQMGSETYNYLADYSKIWWGGGGSSGTAKSMTPPCKGGTNRGGSKMYDDNLGSETPFRVDANGTAPWWFAFEGNKDTTTLTEKPDGTASDGFVAGDRGLVVREFNARLGGVDRERPSFSVLCDKIELGTPKGVRALKKDDFVEMTLEFLVTPRS